MGAQLQLAYHEFASVSIVKQFYRGFLMSNVRALPKSVQTSEMLIREIVSGRLADGTRLPPEREMADELGIAIGTLRKALAKLEEKGLLERVQGSGNYVRAKTDVESVYAFFRLELAKGGGLPTADVLDVVSTQRPDEVTAVFSDRAHRIRRLRYLDAQPVAIEEIWLDAGYVDAIDADGLMDSLYYYYKQDLGLVISQVEDRVGLAVVPDWAPERFGKRVGEMAGYVKRLSFDQNGTPAEFSKTWFDPDAARYTIRLR
jgi:GntR family transcriptional regulator